MTLPGIDLVFIGTVIPAQRRKDAATNPAPAGVLSSRLIHQYHGSVRDGILARLEVGLRHDHGGRIFEAVGWQ